MTASLDDPVRLLLGAQIGITDVPDGKAARRLRALFSVVGKRRLNSPKRTADRAIAAIIILQQANIVTDDIMQPKEVQ